MTGKPQYDRIAGSRGLYHVSGTLQVAIMVVDVRRAYGRVEVQIAPDKGQGLTWVSLDNTALVLDKE